MFFSFLNKDVPLEIGKGELEIRIRITTCVVMCIYYVYKLCKEIGKKDTIDKLTKDIEEIKKILNKNN